MCWHLQSKFLFLFVNHKNKLLTKLLSNKMSKGKIPDRWIPYKACGKVIEGTRIICFKVPLHKRVQNGVPGIKTIWDIPMLLSEIPKLGAVIDLTNTARYYNPRDFQAANVLHRKILMPGREIPPESKVQEFMDTVDEFLGNDCDSLVGVHCTHGLNRTGYMVCRYMRDRLSIPAKDAIKRFEKARGYQIEREIYIASLLGKKLPKPDIGKRTIIKKMNNEKDCVHLETADEDYDSTYNQNGYSKSWRDSDTGKYNCNVNSSDGYLSWRNRGESSDCSTQIKRKLFDQSSCHDKNRSKSKKKHKYDRPYSYIHDY